MFRFALTVLLAFTTVGCATSRKALPPPDPGIPAPPAQKAERNEHTAVQTFVTAVSGGELPEPSNSRVHSHHWLGASSHSDFVMLSGQEQFVGVWVDVPAQARRKHVPMSLTLSIDTSGSMGGEKIRHAQNAARSMVRRMQIGDIVTIHSFSDTARELIPPTEITRRNRAGIMHAIASLRADGATNIYDALRLGTRRAQAAPPSHPIRRVVIISDGRATAGPRDTHTLASVTRHHPDVQITALGVGLDYDEHTLNALAVRSNGRLYHLADARELEGIIHSELKLLQSTMATAAFVEVIPAPGIRLNRVRGSASRWGSSGSLKIPLGVLFAGQHREFLVGFRVVDRQAHGQRPIASARLHYQDPTDSFVPRIHEVVVRGSMTTDAAMVTKTRNRRIEAIIEVQNAADTAQQARQQIMAGQFDDADVALAQAERKLLASAARAKSKGERARLTNTAQRLARSRGYVKRAAKAPPSARPAAARAGSLELNDAAMDAQGY